MATAMPPFAEPSSSVSATPVTPTVSPNRRACSSPFCPVVASTTSRVSCGAPASLPSITRRTFASSSIRFACVCSRPAVSTITTSRPRAWAASIASYATAAGSPPRSEPTKSAPARCAQISSCSSAAARNVSAAATTTECPCCASLAASLPIVVVLPVPLTPTTRTTLGAPPTFSVPGSPKSAATSSARASPRSPSSPRASSRWTSSAVARTPTSAWISASSSRSHAWSSPGSNAAAWICSVSARRDFESESRSRENMPACRSSGSGSPSASPSSCAQLLATAAHDSGELRRADRFGFFARQPPRVVLRDAVAAHRDPVQDVGGLHRALLLRDHDELRTVRVPAQQRDEAAAVRVVERSLDLVEQIERTGPGEEQGEEERDRAERLLAARQERQPLHLLARGPQLDLDAGLALLVLRVGQAQAPFATREERRGDVCEIPLHGVERLGEASFDRLRQLRAQLLELGEALLEILALNRELLEARLLRVVLLLRERIHLAERLTAALEPLGALRELVTVVALGALIRTCLLEAAARLVGPRLDARELDVEP